MQEYIKLETKKEDIIDYIREGAKMACAEKAGTFKLYYTGHGLEKTGNWECKKPQIYTEEDSAKYEISLDDVLREIVKAGYSGNVLIVHDGCFSGHWSYKAQELWFANNSNKEGASYLDFDVDCLSVEAELSDSKYTTKSSSCRGEKRFGAGITDAERVVEGSRDNELPEELVYKNYLSRLTIATSSGPDQKA
tara:strand:+ start:138 stop:716 length:579 start_codon:yes stop_codon:yes gene_type:complete